MDIENLHEALKRAWSKETCYESIRDNWSSENSAYGQCYITTLIVNDYFGGEILKTKLLNGITHYWNLINGKEVDLTRSQFSPEEVIPSPVKLARKDLEENERYKLLKSRVEKNI